MATKKTSTRKTSSGNRRRKPQPDIAQSWSILLFGLGAVLVTMIFVQGESAWAWMRAALFGVFGLGTYVLGLLVLYVAVLVALGLPIWSKCAKALCLMMFLCGTAVVFSQVNLTGMEFGQIVKALYEQGQGALGGGVLGGVVGGTLLVLCGRPAANILLLVLLAAGVMWFAGVTPGDLWNFVSGRYALWRDEQAERQARREEEREETGVILNLASAEYSRAAEPYLSPKTRFVSCAFGSLKDGKVKVKATEAKMARGEMVRYLARNQVKTIKEVREFRALGFSFDAGRSRENCLVFIKE